MSATGRALSLEELTASADAVAIVDVLGAVSFEHDGRVLTRYTLAVRDAWTGTLPQTITVTQLGGRTAQKVTRVAGMPTFAVGERALVFLERTPQDFVVHGMELGKLSVVGRTAVRGPIEMHLVGPNGTTVEPPAPDVFDLQTLRARLLRGGR